MEGKCGYSEKQCVSSSIIKPNVDLMSRMTEILFLLPPHPTASQIQHGMLLIDRILFRFSTDLQSFESQLPSLLSPITPTSLLTQFLRLGNNKIYFSLRNSGP